MAYQQGSSSDNTSSWQNRSNSGSAFSSSHPVSNSTGSFTGNPGWTATTQTPTTTPKTTLPPVVAPKPPESINWTPKVITADQFFNNPVYQDAWQQIADSLGMTPDQAKVQYAGVPVVQLYVDQKGVYQPNSAQFLGASRQIQQLQNMKAPVSFQQWMTQNGYTTADPNAILGYMGDIASQMSQGPNLQAQQDYAAQNIGFTGNAQYQGKLSDLLNGNYQDNPNYAAYQRTVERQAQQVRQESMQMAEAVGLQSSGRQIQLMNETTSKISDSRLQAEMSFIQYDQANRLTEYQALTDANQKAQGAYAQQIYDNRMGALQAYATQLTATLQNRQQYFSEYSGEYKLVMDNADAVYKSIMAQLGYNEAALNDAQNQWNSTLASWKTQFDAQLQQYAVENNVAMQKAQESAQNASTGVSLFGGLLGFLGILALK